MEVTGSRFGKANMLEKEIILRFLHRELTNAKVILDDYQSLHPNNETTRHDLRIRIVEIKHLIRVAEITL